MGRLVVDLAISAEEYLKLYRGTARAVHATSQDGRRIHFPAAILVPFVQRDGIRGRFIIDYDDKNRFRQIQRC